MLQNCLSHTWHFWVFDDSERTSVATTKMTENFEWMCFILFHSYSILFELSFHCCQIWFQCRFACSRTHIHTHTANVEKEIHEKLWVKADGRLSNIFKTLWHIFRRIFSPSPPSSLWPSFIIYLFQSYSFRARMYDNVISLCFSGLSCVHSAERWIMSDFMEENFVVVVVFVLLHVVICKICDGIRKE